MGSGHKTAPAHRLKGPTKAQKAARAANLRAYKENLAPSASAPLAPQKPPQKPVKEVKNWKHEFQKLQRRLRHSKTHQNKLETQLTDFKLADAATKRTAELSAKRIKELSTVIANIVAEGHKKSASSKDTIDTQRKQITAVCGT